ncbi:hypothetical protein [Flavobacterium daemonense]|uniref:hypothetical protein n=1 Tax=Flavobacterium daemonense TaxID=1393049 RepID=UPI00118552A1|nr:hypothetical protein [Flavobacterium daemonense]KAF2331914.1 hypothetical protein FND99_12800 [Flavobacterium daemonense]
MKKKFTLEIANPCSENFEKMTPNSHGSFCNSCMKNVIDLSKKTNSEIAKFIVENKDKNICARLKTTQLEEEFVYTETSKMNTLKYAAVAASILLASNVVEGQEKDSVKTEISINPSNYLVGKVASNQNNLEDAVITLKGRLLEAKTNQPFNRKTFPNLTLSVNGSSERVKINSKTGDFSIPITVLDDRESLQITIQGADYYLSKTIPFNRKNVKGNVLLQDIIINKEELSKAVIMILGGLGINYVPQKKFSEI